MVVEFLYQLGCKFTLPLDGARQTLRKILFTAIHAVVLTSRPFTSQAN